MKRRRSLIFSLLAFGLLSQAGCAGGPRPTEASFRGEAPEDSVRILVTNLNFMDATVWAVATGTRRKLGVVTGKREAVYTIPWEGFTDLYLEFDLLSGPRCFTQSLPVNPGDHIELIIDVEIVNDPMCKWGTGG